MLQTHYVNPSLHEFYFTSILGYNLRYPPIVYRLTDAALIENFFYDPFLFQNLNSSQTSFAKDVMKQRSNELGLS